MAGWRVLFLVLWLAGLCWHCYYGQPACAGAVIVTDWSCYYGRLASLLFQGCVGTITIATGPDGRPGRTVAMAGLLFSYIRAVFGTVTVTAGPFTMAGLCWHYYYGQSAYVGTLTMVFGPRWDCHCGRPVLALLLWPVGLCLTCYYRQLACAGLATVASWPVQVLLVRPICLRCPFVVAGLPVLSHL